VRWSVSRPATASPTGCPPSGSYPASRWSGRGAADGRDDVLLAVAPVGVVGPGDDGTRLRRAVGARVLRPDGEFEGETALAVRHDERLTMSWAYGGGLLEIQYCEPEPPDMSIPPRYTPRAGA
jgi:hypothetical protein